MERETTPPPPLPQASDQLQAMGEGEEDNMEISEDAGITLLGLIPVVDVKEEQSSVQDEEELQGLSDELGRDLTHQQSLTDEKDLPQHSTSSAVHHLVKKEEDSEKVHNVRSPLPVMAVFKNNSKLLKYIFAGDAAFE